MEFSGAGTAIMLAVAALLWLAYLLPTWAKRREYLATERNAVRLQQTLRVMAETAEVPTSVRAESTAREIVAQQRALKQEAQRADAIARAREAAAARAEQRRLAETQPAIAAVVSATSATDAASRLRRTRAITSLILLVSLITGIVQLSVMATTGVVAAAWFVVAASAIVAAIAVWALTRLAQVGRARMARAAVTPTVRREPAPVRSTPQPQVAREWTPVPVPKPLYLSKPELQKAVMAEVDLVAELRRAEEERRRATRGSARRTRGRADQRRGAEPLRPHGHHRRTGGHPGPRPGRGAAPPPARVEPPEPLETVLRALSSTARRFATPRSRRPPRSPIHPQLESGAAAQLPGWETGFAATSRREPHVPQPAAVPSSSAACQIVRGGLVGLEERPTESAASRDGREE